MPAFNVELRKRVAGAFDNADSLGYVKSHYLIIDGLRDEDGKIKIGLLPQAALGGSKRLGSHTFSPATTIGLISGKSSELLTLVGDSTGLERTWAEVCAGLVGAYFVVAADATVTVSTGHTITPGDDGITTVAAGSTVTLEANDFIVINSISGGTGTNNADLLASATISFGIVNNQHGLASGGAAGLMSAADFTKLAGIAANANNYSHPTQSAIDVNAADDGSTIIDRIQVNTSGHVTSVTTRVLSKVTTTVDGIMAYQDKVKIDGIAAGATVGAIEGNHYTPSSTDINLAPSATEEFSVIILDTKGHVINASHAKRTKQSASDTLKGIIEIATTAETYTGSDGTRAVSPAGFKGALDYLAGGIKHYGTVALANAASHPDGAFVFVTC